MKNNVSIGMPSRPLLIAIVALLVFFAVAWQIINHRVTGPIQSHPTYSLNLHSGKQYQTNQGAELMFDIRDQNKKLLKNFDTVHEKQMHLIVVRKDRTNFQHVHPSFDTKGGIFTITDFKFPTDGEYRVFADFTPTNAQRDFTGMKMPATPYQDVIVGNLNNYKPVALSQDKLTSSVGGLDTELVELQHDTANAMTPSYLTGSDTSITVSVKKNGQPFTALESYLGALGHMVVLGPNLEFIHAHPQGAIKDQTGFVLFGVSFPEPGRYKIYLQTQTDGQVSTNDYAITAKGPSGSGGEMDTKANMNNSGQ